jgi:hypothetical protein
MKAPFPGDGAAPFSCLDLKSFSVPEMNPDTENGMVYILMNSEKPHTIVAINL